MGLMMKNMIGEQIVRSYNSYYHINGHILFLACSIGRQLLRFWSTLRSYPLKYPHPDPGLKKLNFEAFVDKDTGNVSGPNFANVILEVVRVG